MPPLHSFGNRNYQRTSAILHNTDAALSLDLLATHRRYDTLRGGDAQFFILDISHDFSTAVLDDQPVWFESERQLARDCADDPGAFFHGPVHSSEARRAASPLDRRDPGSSGADRARRKGSQSAPPD